MGVVSGYGDSGDALVRSREVDGTLFVKEADVRGMATPKDVVEFEVIHEKSSRVSYIRIHSIIEENREGKYEILEDIAKLQGSDGVLNYDDNGRASSFNRKGARELRNYLAYLERESARVDRLKDKLEQLRGESDA